MSLGLKFQSPCAGLGFSQKEDSNSMVVGQNINSHSLLLKEKSEKKVGKISKSKKRWEYLFEFAENHQTLSKQECRVFYKNNPEVFIKDRKSLGNKAGLLGALQLSLLLALIVLGSAPNRLSVVLFAACLIASAFSWIAVSMYTFAWFKMWSGGAKKNKLGMVDFMAQFENDENLKALWFDEKGSNPANIFEKACARKEKEIREINAYQETRRWLQKWSRGDVDNLCWVEWRTLYGMTQRYKKYLTPVENPEVS